MDALTGFVAKQPDRAMDALHQHIRGLHGVGVLDDDLSMLEARFAPPAPPPAASEEPAASTATAPKRAARRGQG